MARIGKNVLESLTRSMYPDSKCVYREYIQNAADQIDAAKKIHPELEYNVYVTIDQQNKNIIIEDNATGVKSDEVRSLLIDIARSIKERGVNKGFRGIGRLGGLAYCKTLKFETSYFEEDIISIVTWDAVLLNHILDDNSDDRDAGDVIEAITTISSQKNENIRDKHYFKVIMESVTDAKLLIEKEIRDYLSMVAPVDYSNIFVYRRDIYQFMKEHNLKLDCYNIFVGDNQIFKDYSISIFDPKGQEEDKITGVKFWYETNSEGNPMYWGWYGISSLKGVISVTNNARNIRLRCENIQLGNENACQRFLPGDKQKYVRWFFGEVHVISSNKLIPNSQRDYLREDEAVREFENNVENNFLKLEKLCYLASNLRSEEKNINKAIEEENKIIQKRNKGFNSEAEQKKAEADFAGWQKKKDTSIQRLQKMRQQMIETDSPLLPIFNPLGINDPQKHDIPDRKDVPQIGESSPKMGKSNLRIDKPIYDKFQPQVKELIAQIYSIIAETLSNNNMGDALIEKIEREITK
ncbi:MAG: ATP-binding protein [Bacteroidales bacterium]|nr:ATP-binding protein [Bacteroidales bacterium]